MFFDHPVKSTVALIVGAVGSWTLPGVLAVLASTITIVVGTLQLYDWIRRRRRKKAKR